ncbi:MAG: DNA polymerase III subunit delta' [Candidatus Omnitrophota bacterium]
MSFQNIIGQEFATHMLQGCLEQGRLQGGLLFTGPQGVGKKLMAETLAKAVNCEQLQTDSCDRCVSCLKIDRHVHPDIHLIESDESEIKIDDIRQLQREICLRPYEARFKVFILNDAHRLTAEASGALLKTLEEPPGNSLIILISDKPVLLFKTVVSRCKTVRFRPLEQERLQEVLINKHGLDLHRAHYLAYVSEGRLGCALRLKETDVLKEKNVVIDSFLFSRRSSFDHLSKEDRFKVREDLNILATWFRDIYCLKIGMPPQAIIHEDRKYDLLKVMDRFSFPELHEIMNAITRSIFYLEHNINIKLLLYDLRSQVWKGTSTSG